MTDKITTTAKLIEQGYLVPAKLYVRPAVLEHELHAGSVVEAYKSTCAGKRVIVYASTGAHAEFLAAQFNAAGIMAYTLLARDNRVVRQAAIESFNAGMCMVLITINVDLAPSTADGVIIASPHHSASRYEHQIVSAMRPRFAPDRLATDAMRRAAIAGSGKPVAMILDLADNWQRHPDVITSVTHRAKPDTHLTIPGSLEWDQTPASGQKQPTLTSADSVAKMVIEWVESGIKNKADWREGLPRIIALRLARYTRPEAAATAESIARAIWDVRREHEDRCDMELEDLGRDHPVWDEARAVEALLIKEIAQ